MSPWQRDTPCEGWLMAPLRRSPDRVSSPGYPFTEIVVTLMPEYYSINEAKKPAAHRVFHNNNVCVPAKDIPAAERRPGRNGYRLCDDCQKWNNQSR